MEGSGVVTERHTDVELIRRSRCFSLQVRYRYLRFEDVTRGPGTFFLVETFKMQTGRAEPGLRNVGTIVSKEGKLLGDG